MGRRRLRWGAGEEVTGKEIRVQNTEVAFQTSNRLKKKHAKEREK
jgi:hypothetical protein